MSCREVMIKSVLAMLIAYPLHSGFGQSHEGKAATGEEEAVWEHDCAETSGWIDNSIDPAIGASLDLESGKGIMIVRQDGKDAWGKTAFLVNAIDLSEAPTLEVKVTQVDKGSAFKIGIAPTDWSDFIEVIKRSSADGVHKGDIEKAVKRAGRKDLLNGPASFYLVIVVEGKGKATYFDHLKISSGR